MIQKAQKIKYNFVCLFYAIRIEFIADIASC